MLSEDADISFLKEFGRIFQKIELPLVRFFSHSFLEFDIAFHGLNLVFLSVGHDDEGKDHDENKKNNHGVHPNRFLGDCFECFLGIEKHSLQTVEEIHVLSSFAFVSDDLSILEKKNPLGLIGNISIVSDYDDGVSLGVNFVKQGENFLSSFRIQITCWLVC